MTSSRIDGPVSIERATRLCDRLRGLLGRPGLAAGEVLAIAPCSAIHTFGMRFAIDVAFVGRDGRVLRIDRHVVPWRVRWCPAARQVLEMAAGEAARLGLSVGLRWQGEVAR